MAIQKNRPLPMVKVWLTMFIANKAGEPVITDSRIDDFTAKATPQLQLK